MAQLEPEPTKTPELEIFVVLLGDSPVSMKMFSVTAPASDSVSKWRNRVYNKALNRLKGYDENDLILWKFNKAIPSDQVDTDVAALAASQNLSEVAVKMLPTDELSDHFSETLPRKSLHVIVELPSLPSAGQKHGLSDDDADGAPASKRKQGRRSASPLAPIDALTAPRNLTVDALYERLNRYHLVLVRGTPASGKSTLAQLLVKYIRKKEPTSDLMQIASWPRDGPPWHERLTTPIPDIIIIDDAQLTYWDVGFWNGFLKGIRPHSINRVILFASYGSPTGRISVDGTPMIVPDCQRVSLRPVDHKDGIAQAGLFLAKDEFDDMVKKSLLPNRLREDLLEWIFRVTAGHTGAVYELLRIVLGHNSYRQLRSTEEEYSLEIFQSQISIGELSLGLRSSGIFRRGLPIDSELQEPDVARVFRAVLSNNYVTEQMLHSPEDKVALGRCFKMGWLHATTNQEKIRYIFTTPLHQWFVEYYLGTSVSVSTPITDQDILAFAINVIRRFSPLQLSSPREIGASNLQRPPEAQFQDEFYRCCHKYSNGSLISFPEFGTTKGRVDFYIPYKTWGVELLRDGDRLVNHSSRFTGPGAYAQMGFADYIILDFRKVQPSKPHPGIPKLYHVVFGNDYRHVHIRRGSTLETVEEFELLNA